MRPFNEITTCDSHMPSSPPRAHRVLRVLTALAVAAGLSLTTACQGPQARTSSSAPAAATGAGVPSAAGDMVTAEAAAHRLREGDVVKLTFPTAPNLDGTHQIRRDGVIALPLIGEIQAAGLTPAQLEQTLTEAFSTELVSGEVFVSVVSSSFPIFVTGAVVRPGKIEADRPMTALEAIMEAGGFELTKANGEQVVVVRHGRDGVKNYTLDLRKVLEGQSNDAFYLQPSDIVYVPERFAWF